jgi:hypothetical protein
MARAFGNLLAPQNLCVIPERREAASPESIITGAGAVDSGLLAEPTIRPRDFARARWLGPGMTSYPSIFEKSATARVASRI